MKAGILISVLALLVGTAATSAGAASTAQQRLHKSESVVRFFTNPNHSWLLATRKDKCWEVPWQRSCLIARKLVVVHRTRTIELRRLMFRTIPTTNDWRTAVRVTQRVFPGTESWLLYISDREGGWGPFVMNHQGSGAGGWMQFLASTFYGYNDAARQAVAARGFDVDPAVFEWHNPLGQALTAGYMRYTGRDGCHWCL